eukprot:SAG11_NODE_3173_length_2635_cov_1.511435_2_plen_166_part_00
MSTKLHSAWSESAQQQLNFARRLLWLSWPSHRYACCVFMHNIFKDFVKAELFLPFNIRSCQTRKTTSPMSSSPRSSRSSDGSSFDAQMTPTSGEVMRTSFSRVRSQSEPPVRLAGHAGLSALVDDAHAMIGPSDASASERITVTVRTIIVQMPQCVLIHYSATQH